MRATRLAAVGLALGGVLGMAGSMMPDPHWQALCWMVDSSGIVMAGALLAVHFGRAGQEVLAAGFLVLAIASGVMLSGTAAGPHGSVPAFGAGAMLWSVALVMISTPRHFPLWVRVVGVLAAVLFLGTAALIFGIGPLLPTDMPLPMLAYPLLVLAFAGWIATLLRDPPQGGGTTR